MFRFSSAELKKLDAWKSNCFPNIRYEIPITSDPVLILNVYPDFADGSEFFIPIRESNLINLISPIVRYYAPSLELLDPEDSSILKEYSILKFYVGSNRLLVADHGTQRILLRPSKPVFLYRKEVTDSIAKGESSYDPHKKQFKIVSPFDCAIEKIFNVTDTKDWT